MVLLLYPPPSCRRRHPTPSYPSQWLCLLPSLSPCVRSHHIHRSNPQLSSFPRPHLIFSQLLHSRPFSHWSAGLSSLGAPQDVLPWELPCSFTLYVVIQLSRKLIVTNTPLRQSAPSSITQYSTSQLTCCSNTPPILGNLPPILPIKQGHDEYSSLSNRVLISSNFQNRNEVIT